MKKYILSILLAMTIILGNFNTSFATQVYEIPSDIEQILEKSQEMKSESGQTYNMIVVPEEELQSYIDIYSKELDNPRARNILPNLVTFSYTRSTYSVTMKVTNIAIDSLDCVYGYINLYNFYGVCGSGNFSFYRIPPMGSDYATITSYKGPWDGGMMFAEAMDGTVSNSGVFYFSR